MANQFGNYLCQKIIEVCSPRDLLTVVNSIQTSVAVISASAHGTRAMQTLVEVIASNIAAMEGACMMLINELSVDILAMSTNANSNHVI